MRKEDKGVIIGQLAETVKQYGHFYLVDTTAMDAAKTSELRRKCFKAGIKLVVVKNSLLHKALMSMEGVDFSPLFDSLKGTTSVMFSEVANAPAKLLKEYKEEIPALKAAYAEEGFYVGANQLDALCNIKSKNEVIADITFRRGADVERRDQGDALSDGAVVGGAPRLARHLPPRYRQGIAGGKGRGRGEEHRDRHTGGNRACGT